MFCAHAFFASLLLLSCPFPSSSNQDSRRPFFNTFRSFFLSRRTTNAVTNPPPVTIPTPVEVRANLTEENEERFIYCTDAAVPSGAIACDLRMLLNSGWWKSEEPLNASSVHLEYIRSPDFNCVFHYEPENFEDGGILRLVPAETECVSSIPSSVTVAEMDRISVRAKKDPDVGITCAFPARNVGKSYSYMNVEGIWIDVPMNKFRIYQHYCLREMTVGRELQKPPPCESDGRRCRPRRQ